MFRSQFRRRFNAVSVPIARKYERGIHRLLIVTSNFHTHRSGVLFRKSLSPEIEIRMIAVPDPHFTPDGWWKDREGQKTFFFEWTKNIASFLNL